MIFLWEQLVYSVMKKKTSLSLYYYLFNFVNILYILQNYIVPP